MYDMNVIVMIEALLLCAAVIVGSTIFILAGLSGKFHFKRKKKGKGDGGW